MLDNAYIRERTEFKFYGGSKMNLQEIVTKKYNKANCEALGITVPDDYVAIEE